MNLGQKNAVSDYSAVRSSFRTLRDKQLISEQKFFFPATAELGGALWLGIAAFLYATFNTVSKPGQATHRRKSAYLDSRFAWAESKFDAVIRTVAESSELQALCYSVLIYEDFNRTRLHRFLERALFKIGRARTLGVMQVRTDRPISDEESVELGCKKLVRAYREELVRLQSDSDSWESMFNGSRNAVRAAAADYNRDDTYVHEVMAMFAVVVERHYPDVAEQYDKERKASLQRMTRRMGRSM